MWRRRTSFEISCNPTRSLYPGDNMTWGICQNYGPFLGPHYNTGPNTGPNLGDPKRDPNFDNHPHGVEGRPEE